MPFSQLPPRGITAQGALAWQGEPCRGQQVSGDAIFLEIDRDADTCWMVLLIDVTGKGSPAAEVVSHVAEMLLTERDGDNLDPTTLLHRLHGNMGPVSAEINRYVEAVAILIDPENSAVRTSTAGAIRPWIGVPGNWVQWLVPGRTWLGLGDPTDALPEEEEANLPGGGWLLTFSDGVSDMVSGQSRSVQNLLDKFLNGLPTVTPPATFLAALFQALAGLNLNAWPVDDTTAFCWQAARFPKELSAQREKSDSPGLSEGESALHPGEDSGMALPTSREKQRDEELRGELNRLLLLLLLHEPGTVGYILAEEALKEAVVSTRWFREADAYRVLDYLIPRWRLGEVFDLRRGFLKGVHTQLAREFRELPAYRADLTQLSPEMRVIYEDFSTFFMGVLAGKDRALFEAWVNDPYPGWQRRYNQGLSEDEKESEATTSRRVRELRTQLDSRLPEQEFEGCAQDYVWRLHFLRAAAAPLDDPNTKALPSPAGSDNWEVAAVLRDFLRQVFAAHPPWRGVLDLLNAVPAQPLRQLAEDHMDALNAMYERFAELRPEVIEAVLGALRCYHRLTDPRINMVRVLAGNSPEDQARGRRLLDLAQQGTLFLDLAPELGQNQDEVVQLLNRFWEIYRRWNDRGYPRA